MKDRDIQKDTARLDNECLAACNLENDSVNNRADTNIENHAIGDSARLEKLNYNGGALRLTEAQRQAVLASGRVMVSAAAGSGKTSTMVSRIMLHIAEGGSLRNMLVLVYNNAAADELKERLNQSLFEAACDSVGAERERFRDELDGLGFARISTIHGFCQTLIRENFDKLGISPTFEVLDETSHRVYMQQALDNVFCEYAENDDKAFYNISEIFSCARKEDNLRDNVVRLFNILDIQPDKSVFLEKVRACFDDFDSSAFFDLQFKSYMALFRTVHERITDLIPRLAPYKQEKYLANLYAVSGLCNAMLSCDTFPQMVAIAQGGYEKLNTNRGKNVEEEEKLLTDMAKEYISVVDDAVKELCNNYTDMDALRIAHQQNAEFVEKIMEIVQRFGDELARLKREDNVLSFEDLQHYAVELLSIAPNVAQGIECVFVDEYQDVNPTQEFIINAVLGNDAFMVGDVKQSIYGFRLADPTIFIAREKEYGNGAGTALAFNRNFRSGRNILAFVNGVFDVVMTQESADVDYKNTARFELDSAPQGGSVEMHIFLSDKKSTNDAVGLYDITAHVNPDESISASVNEGRYIAAQIRALIGRAKGDGGYISYGDVAILLRSRNTAAQTILDTLRDEGVPIDDGGFSKSAASPERELVLLLNAIDNPRQDIPLAGLLLSFFGGYSEQDLADIAAYEGECLYDKLLACAQNNCNNPDKSDIQNNRNAELSARLRDTLEMLDMYRIKASFKNVSELMCGIISDFSYDAYLMRNSEADVYSLRTFAQSNAAKDAQSVGRFLKAYSEGESDSIKSAGGDRVHIATFHGYKGLESPVVFIADAACLFNTKSRTGDIVVSDSGYIGLNYFDFGAKTKASTLSKLTVARLLRERETKEEMRLLYVALTRAKQYMYITASVSDAKSKAFGRVPRIESAGCPLDFISNAICDGSLDVPIFRHTGGDNRDKEVKGERYMLAGSDNALADEIASVRGFVYPYAESTKLAMKYSVSALDSIDEDTVRVYDESANIGIAYHKVMQHIDYFAQGESGVAAELERMEKDGILLPEERAAVKVIDIARCLESPLMELARESEKSGHCYRERAFMMYKPASEVSEKFNSRDKVLVQGVVDLIIDGKEKIIVDFKNSYLRDEQTVQKYKKQLYLYKTAVESVIGAKIDKTLLYSFKSGKVVEV